MSQVDETMSTLETANVLPSWSIFMPEGWSDAGRFPPLWVELPAPPAEGELDEAEGLVLALPLDVVPVPGALSLIAPPLGEVELAVLLPAGEVVVVVVVVEVVVLSALLVEAVVLLIPELLLAAPLCQSPWTFTEWPTCAERSWLLSRFAILPFFSCSKNLPPCETMHPLIVLPLILD
jgi:hypothetical protein